ncbi:MAG: LacI family transcriptional regulator [Reinekea forsetii]|jgi:LacI family transcriptional regulator|nr:LacI family transcriptional regulator [Reinekea forsetii]MDO7673451.1 LacI family transcriptional regulator [Reinekea forsetii]
MAKSTLREVAKLAGVSVATVSRVLNGQIDRVRPSTRELVESASEKLGFKLDRAARRLRTGETRVIAYILNRSDPSAQFVSELLLGLSDRALLDEYHVVIVPEAEISPIGSVEYLIESKNCDGVVLTHTRLDDARVRWLQAENFPFITHGQTRCSIEHDFVDYDHLEFLRLCFAELKPNSKRIALICPPTELTFFTIMTEAFQAVLLPHPEMHGSVITEINVESTVEKISDWARRESGRYDAIISYHDGIIGALIAGTQPDAAVQFMTRVFGHNRSHVPESVFLLHQDVYQDGWALADALIGKLQGKPATPYNSHPKRSDEITT